MSFFQGEVPHLLSTYGYAAVAGMGIPLPGETTLIAAALVPSTTHDLNVLFVIAAAAGGAILRISDFGSSLVTADTLVSLIAG